MHGQNARLRFIRFALAFYIFLLWLGQPFWSVRAAQAQADEIRMAVPPAGQLKTLAAANLSPAIAPDVSKTAVTRADALADAVPQIEYDLTARAKSLGDGVEPIFTFVRDQIRFESYDGVLRGSRGTYTARAGNAADRALLLAAMLKEKGVQTRYARGKLAEADAQRLLERIFDPPAAASTSTPPGTKPALDAQPAKQLIQRLHDRAARDYAAIRTALGSDLPADKTTARDELLKETSDHWWVQAQVAGKWVDLDPSFKDAQPGKAYCKAQSTFDSVADKLCQRITMRVISEELAGEKLKSTVALEFTGAVVDLLDRQIFLAHAKGAGGGISGGIGGGIAASGGGELWTPVLWIDGQQHGGKPVVFNETAAAPKRGEPPRGGLGGMFGKGGALAGGQPVTVAEWLEFEINYPGGRRELTRRALLNRGGAAWRAADKLDAAALAPMPADKDGLISPRQLHNIWLTAGRHNLADYAWASQAYCRLDPSVNVTEDFGFKVWPFALQNFALPVLSDHLVVPSLNDRPDVRFYADSPRIMIATLSPRGDGGGEVNFDLRRDGLRAVARPAAPAGAVAERKLWFATLEGALEHEMASGSALAAGLEDSAVVSTSRLLDGGEALVLKPGSETTHSLSNDADASAQITQALKQQAIVVLPQHATSAAPGWWEISPDGDVRAAFGELNGAYNRFGYDKPNISGPGKTIQVPDNPGHLPEGTGLPGEGAPRRPNFTLDDLKNNRGRPLAPKEEDKKKTGGPEYPAMIKEGTKLVLIVALPMVAEHVIRYGVATLANQVQDALQAGMAADRLGA